MRRQSIGSRLNDLEEGFKAPKLPLSICVKRNGSTQEYRGYTVITPFLDDDTVSVVCDDVAMAELLRAMDERKTKRVEIAWLDGDDVQRESI